MDIHQYKDYTLHEIMPMPDPQFPIKAVLNSAYQSDTEIFPTHWHQHLEFLFFTEGEGIIYCNSKPYYAQAGDLIVINSNDLHRGQSLSVPLHYHCIILDIQLLQSKVMDSCETKYMIPIQQNRILFENKISNNSKIQSCIITVIHELKNKKLGFELAVKSSVFQLLTLLFRHHATTILSDKEYTLRIRNIQRLNPILQYIYNHYTEKITLDLLCSLANSSRYHFCRVFKQITNKTPIEYINFLRIHHAENLLKQTDMNVTEIALASGFNNLNYFSRTFKKYKKISPSMIKKES
ncbi:MAG: AraC family transcriptional regulator [Epulopiscium sp.]|nr:AraC family transcriptional regulator [Candidatus Epulonipiscium sp.]